MYNVPLRLLHRWTNLNQTNLRKGSSETPFIHLISPVGHGEGELVGVLLFFAGVDVLDAA